MFRQIKKFMLVAVAVGVVMGGSTPALGDIARYGGGELERNDTGSPAGCMKKVVEGNVVNGTVWSLHFAHCKVDHVYGFSVITCWGADLIGPKFKDGEVASGDYDFLTYGCNSEPVAEDAVGCKTWKWYSAYDPDPAVQTCTGYLGSSKPKSLVGMLPVPTGGGSATLVVEHGAEGWNDETQQPTGVSLGPVELWEVYWAKTNTLRRPEQLTEDLFTDPSIDWVLLEDTRTLANLEDDWSYNLGQLEYGDIVIFRYYSEDSLRAVRDFELVQICAGQACIPAVTEWGLVIIAMLVLTAGTVVIGRRRAMAAQA